METGATLNQIAFIGDYVPRQCGIATFTHDLCEAVAEASPETQCIVGAVNDNPGGYAYSPRVRFEFDERDLDSYRRAADFLNINNVEVLCVQHEFGIYGGPAGSHLLALLRDANMPVVTTLHTLLEKPDEQQRQVMKELTDRSDSLVVMAQKGISILSEVYGAPSDKIELIPHGIPDTPFIDSNFYKDQFGVLGRTVLLTFGLLSPSKGIEYVIDALPAIRKAHPEIVYIVLGATHPQLLASDGENYRLQLERRAEARGVKENIIFYNRFVSQRELNEFMAVADIYLTPYLSETQITSGTLAYAFGAGKAVISTPYWHAQELLDENRGILVPFRNSEAIAKNVCEMLNDTVKLQKLRKKAYLQGREMIWPVIAKRYLEVFNKARKNHTSVPRQAFGAQTLAQKPYQLPPFKLGHLFQMTDSNGMLQHAIYTVPNYREGYCTDDNARALLLTVLIEGIRHDGELSQIATAASRYLAFICHAFEPETARFRNFMSFERKWLEHTGSEDSHARAVWALGTALWRSNNEGHRKLSNMLFEKALPTIESFASPRAWAYGLLGIHEYFKRFEGDREVSRIREVLTEKLLNLWRNVEKSDWPWMEEKLSYDNPRLAQALILSGHWIPNSEALDAGLKGLRWLIKLQTSPKGHFRPIGCNGFFSNTLDQAAQFDQQPIEAYAMISACLEAFRVTKDPHFSGFAQLAFEWFLGHNDLGQSLYDPSTGGCHDALHEDRLNENEGAESSLSFYLSMAEMRISQNLIQNNQLL
jgi:glycosyltransferase involved in cell wall biosynthesis